MPPKMCGQGKHAMTTGIMPRRFWVYTAGKDDPRAAEREAKREQRRRWMRETLPGLLALGFIMLLTGVMFLMMLAEFRGYYLDQLWHLLIPARTA
jgi:hypothetical protein